MTRADATGVAALQSELGYQGTAAQLEQRFASLPSAIDAAFVAVDGEVVTGWIHVHIVQTLTSERRAEILGLVVAENARRGGIGRALVTSAEAWARDQGLTTVRVRCSVVRAEAHGFYRALGYESSKRQEVFDKRCLQSGAKRPEKR